MLIRTREIMAETCKQMDCVLLAFGGEDDHIHMLISAHPKIAGSNLVSKLKGKSAYILRREFWERVKTMLWGNHFWSPSYCVVSCGGASLDLVKEYINNQHTPAKEGDVARSRALTKVKIE